MSSKGVWSLANVTSLLGNSRNSPGPSDYKIIIITLLVFLIVYCLLSGRAPNTIPGKLTPTLLIAIKEKVKLIHLGAVMLVRL